MTKLSLISETTRSFYGRHSLSNVIDALYEDGVIKPKGKLDVPEGTMLRIRVENHFFGMLREWHVDTEELMDELRKLHG